MVRFLVFFQVEPDKRSHFIEVATKMVTATRLEKGCIGYEIRENQEDPNGLILFETWAPQEDSDNHLKSDHFAELVPQMGQCCTVPPTMIVHSQII